MNKKYIIISCLFLLCSIHSSIAGVNSNKSDNNKNNDSLQQPQQATPNKVLELKEAWARPSLSPNKNSAIYLKIKNNSSVPYALVKAATIVANNVELHQSYIDENKISRMAVIGKIIIPANSEIELAPGGIHIMLLDLKRALKEGDKFQVSLNFEVDNKHNSTSNLNIEESVDVYVKFNNGQ